MSFRHNVKRVEGESWTRADSIFISHQIDAVPSVTFTEEKVIQVGDEYLRKPEGTRTLMVDETLMNQPIPVFDPITGEDTGQTVTFAGLYAMICSAYDYAVKNNLGRFPDPTDVFVDPEPVPQPAPETDPEPAPEEGV